MEKVISMKKGIRIILYTVFVLTLIFFSSAIAETVGSGSCGSDAYWKIDEDGNLEIFSHYDNGKITSHPWTAKNVKTVYISDGIVEIGASTFSGCTNLTVVTIPSSVEKIQEKAFYNCKALQYVYLPEELKTIPDYAFYGCSQLSSVVMSNVSYIGDYAFANCSNLRSMEFPDSLISIGNHSFSQSGLTFITMRDCWRSSCSIGEYAFYRCRSLVHIFSPVASIVLNAAEEQIPVEGTTQLTANVTTEDSNSYVNEYVTFASENTILAEVDSNGTVYALHPGIVTLTATSSNGISGSVQIEVIGGSHVTAPNDDIPATCTQAGYTGGTHCEICGCILEAADEIPALGHLWGEPNYVWNDDNSQVTATHVCQRNVNHTETETVNTTYEIIQEGTCIVAGRKFYHSSAFQTDGFETQNKEADYYSPHELIYHAKTAPTCTERGYKEYWECSVCGKLFSDEAASNQISSIPIDFSTTALGHKYASIHFYWNETNTKVTAKRVCMRNKEHERISVVDVVEVTIVSPTNDSQGSITYLSDEIPMDGYKRQVKTETIPSLGEMSVLRLPSQVTNIEDESFAGGDFQAVIIPSGCTSIGYHAFANCPNLIYIQVQGSATSIDEEAFTGSGYVIIDKK